MRLVVHLFLLLSASLLAGPALAQTNVVNQWGYPGCFQGKKAVSSGAICFDMNSALSPAFTTFVVQSETALACLKTDVDQEGVSATGASPVTAIVRFCPYGAEGATATNEENCGIRATVAAGDTLTGLNGVPANQLACVPLGPGTYRVDFPTLPDGADVGLFSVQGSGVPHD